MTPNPVGRDAQVSGPSMQVAQTSMAWGQRRMVGRSSSITERASAAAQAVQTTTVNGRSVPPCGDVNGQSLSYCPDVVAPRTLQWPTVGPG